MDELKKEVDEDAVVVGGSGENARKCISAASSNIKLEIMPEVRQLSDMLTKSEGQSKERTTEQNEKASRDEAALEKRNSSIRVSKKSASAAADKKPLRIKKSVAVTVSVLFVMLTVFVIYEIYKVSDIMDSVNYVPGSLNFDKVDVLVSESEMVGLVSHTDETKNILLCGCDIDQNGISRTDSMIILTIDHEHQKIKMTSLMRDMYLKIPGHGKNKLNASFTFGGGDLLLKTIYSNFGMKIEKYVCVDYEVFASVVDDLGGVEILLPYTQGRFGHCPHSASAQGAQRDHEKKPQSFTPQGTENAGGGGTVCHNQHVP